MEFVNWLVAVFIFLSFVNLGIMLKMLMTARSDHGHQAYRTDGPAIIRASDTEYWYRCDGTI